MGCAALSGFATSQTIPLQRLSLSVRRVLARDRLRSCDFPLAQTAVTPSRLRRFGPDHAPSISCAAVFRYPAERSRNLAGFFAPATLLGFNTLRSFAPVRGSDRLLASCAHLPFVEHPTPIIWSGGQSLKCHTHSVARLTAGARRGSWVFSPRASRSLRISRRMGRYCRGLVPLSGLRTPETPACRRGFLSPPIR